MCAKFLQCYRYLSFLSASDWQHSLSSAWFLSVFRDNSVKTVETAAIEDDDTLSNRKLCNLLDRSGVAIHATCVEAHSFRKIYSRSRLQHKHVRMQCCFTILNQYKLYVSTITPTQLIHFFIISIAYSLQCASDMDLWFN